MMTHILDPTHLSTSSAVPVSNVARPRVPEGEAGWFYLGVGLEMPSSLHPTRLCTETAQGRNVVQVCWAGLFVLWWDGWCLLLQMA
jgi:hypothetical protein